MTKLIGIYTRISEDDAGEQTSTARQERLCRAWAQEHGHVVAGAYEMSVARLGLTSCALPTSSC